MVRNGAERRVFQWFYEPTGRPAAVCCILLAYTANHLPFSKLLLVMWVEHSTCNYSTPVVCLNVDMACWIDLKHHSWGNMGFKAFSSESLMVEIWPSKIINYLRLLLIKVLSRFAELRARLKEGWQLDNVVHLIPPLAFLMSNYYSCAWQLKPGKYSVTLCCLLLSWKLWLICCIWHYFTHCR